MLFIQMVERTSGVFEVTKLEARTSHQPGMIFSNPCTKSSQGSPGEFDDFEEQKLYLRAERAFQAIAPNYYHNHCD